MTVDLSIILNAPPDRVWDEANRPALLKYVSKPLVTFEPLDPPDFPERWAEREYVVSMKLFGLVPLGQQVIGIERPVSDGAARRLRDNGRGASAKRWDHMITVEPAEDGMTRYTDRIELEAGILTPFVWAFARVFYAHRQRRWRLLVKRGFQYE